MHRRFALVLAPLALTSLLLVGCGDDGKDASPTTTDGATTTEGADDGSTTTDGTDTTEDGTTTEGTTEGGTTTEGTGTTEGNGATGDFCTDFQALNELFQSAPDGTIEDLQEGAASFADAAADLVDIAPAEIADDMQVMADFFAELRDAVADATSIEDAEGIAGDLRTPGLDTAGQAVSTWASENCADAG